ncbi:MAG: hypothetical protein NTV49_06855 [Kiritimatiellaeota bacterium]|nr:hypothetical protein [Kiritimatiellota bacterium]
MKTTLLILALLAWTGGGFAEPAGTPAAAPADTQSLKIYALDPNNEAVVQVLRSLVSTNDLVTPDRINGRILVITTAARHAQIAQSAASLRVPPRNVKIEVRFNQAGRDSRAGVSVGAHGGAFATRDSLHIGRIRISPSLTESVTQASSTVSQFLVVASGREAALFVGAEVPYLDYILDYGVQYGVLAERIAWQKVGAYLLVQPTILGDGRDIEIRLTPSLSGTVAGRPYETRFTALATVLTVCDGATVNLGGLGQSAARSSSRLGAGGGAGQGGRPADFYAKFLVGRDRGGAEQSLNITLTPHIVGPDGR